MPNSTLLKARLAGLAASVAGAIPVPLRATVTGVEDELTVSERVPLTLPAASGAKATLKVELWPGTRVRGRVSPL